jgi:hypothetical protein
MQVNQWLFEPLPKQPHPLRRLTPIQESKKGHILTLTYLEGVWYQVESAQS